MPDEKGLRAVRQVTVEQVVEAENGCLHLEGVNIGGTEYRVAITNQNGRLVLDFNEKDFVMVIDENGIRFERTAYRPNHDHNDYEKLQVRTEEGAGPAVGTVQWLDRGPYQREGWCYYTIPFGPVTKEY
jgi:hypothetical protein